MKSYYTVEWRSNFQNSFCLFIRRINKLEAVTCVRQFRVSNAISSSVKWFNESLAWWRHFTTSTRMLWGKLLYSVFFFCEESLLRDTNLHNEDCSEMHSGSCSQMTSSCKCLFSKKMSFVEILFYLFNPLRPRWDIRPRRSFSIWTCPVQHVVPRPRLDPSPSTLSLQSFARNSLCLTRKCITCCLTALTILFQFMIINFAASSCLSEQMVESTWLIITSTRKAYPTRCRTLLWVHRLAPPTAYGHGFAGSLDYRLTCCSTSLSRM